MRLWTHINTVRGFVLCVILAFLLVAGAVHVARASADPPSQQYVTLVITFSGDETWYMADEDGNVEVWEFHEGETVSFWYNTGNSGWIRLSGDSPVVKTRVVIGAANG